MTDLSKYTGKELFDFLVQNKEFLLAEKKCEIKKADAISYLASLYLAKDETSKAPASSEELLKKESLDIEIVVNTTNIMDSHSDVHIPKLWNKSLKENKNLYLLQEHEMSFDHIISDEVKASVKTYKWSDLGYDVDGETEALIFRATIKKSRNEYMFGQYANGWVKNHSVGMRYVNLALAINDNDYAVEKSVWDEFIGQIINRKDAEEKGYFWVVREAKVIEGSAVPIGSNRITPTLSTKETIEPSTDTQQHIEPPLGTQKGLLETIGSRI